MYDLVDAKKTQAKSNVSLHNLTFPDVLANIPSYVFWKNTDGTYAGCNTAYANSLGFATPADIIGKTDHDFKRINNLDMAISTDKEVLAAGKPIITEDSNYLIQKAPLTNNKGEIIGILGISINIAEYQNRNHQDKHMLDEILAVMPGHVYWKNRNCVLLGCNEQQAKDAGFSSRYEIPGKSAYDLLWQDQPEEDKREQTAITNSIDEEVMSKNLTRTMEEFVVLPNGEKVYCLSKKAPLHDEHDNVIGLVGISFDITDRKKLELKLENASKEKTEYIATLNNILRSHINTISMMAEMIRTTGLTEEQEKYLKLLEEANNSMPDDLTYAGDYAKLDSGEIDIYKMPLRLLYTIDSLQKQFYQRAKNKGLDFIVDYTNLSSIWLYSSVTQLKEIINTLIEHSLQYTDTGHIRVSFEKKQIAHNSEITIIIEDTSQGFEADYLQQIFSEEGLAAEKETDYPLMSMRFAFCRKMVEALDGKIHAESSKNHGACFYLTFKESAADPGDLLTEREYYHSANLHQYMLIGEDNLNNRALLSLFDKKSINLASPHKADITIKNTLEETGELDMILIDQELTDERPDLIPSILEVINSDYTLLIVLCDAKLNNTLANILRENKNVITIDKPISTKIYHKLRCAWSSFCHRSLSVLVVEDAPIAQKCLAVVLEKLKCEVTGAGSGEKALERLQPNQNSDTINGFDVIFLDIGLPGKDGLETAREIHKLFPYDCPPLIALTGLTRKVDLDTLYESGLFKAVLEKPATLKSIEDALSYIFDAADQD